MKRPSGKGTRPAGIAHVLRPVSIALVLAVVTGCTAGRNAYNLGVQAELAKDYDQALVHYEEALEADPGDAQYQLKVEKARIEAAFAHFEEGRRAIERGQLDLARAELMRATQLDPANDLAMTELERVDELLASGAPQEPGVVPDFETRNEDARVDPSPSLRLSPTVEGPIDLVMNQDAVTVFETIGALTGLNVLFDSNFSGNPPLIDVTIDDMSVYQALDLVALLSNSFWVPVSQNTVMVAPNNTQARANYEQRIMKTIYLENSINPADITEIMAALRQLLQINAIAQMTSQNAIMIVDTPDRVAIAEEIVRAFDLAKPEVLVEARVLEVDRQRLRELGILPPQGTSLSLNPATVPDAPFVPLRDLNNLNSGDFNLVIPDTVANFLENDSHTRLVQNPSVRSSDGVLATIRIGQRVPVASGSFQPAFVGATGTPVVQFQYIDVGVNMDITPRVLRNREISMNVTIQIAGTAGQSDLGGIVLPIFSNREVTHEIRLREGETNVLGGLISNIETRRVNGLPALGNLPIFGRLFSTETLNGDETEILILLTPHIMKMPTITDRTLSGVMVGTQNDLRYRGLPAAAQPETAVAQASPAAAPAAALRVDASTGVESELFSLEPADDGTLELRMKADNMAGADLTIEFDPETVTFEDVAEGGLLSRDGNGVTLTQTIDRERGMMQISLDRPTGTPGISGEGPVLALRVDGAGADGSGLRIGEVRIRRSAVESADANGFLGSP